jgi:hypothetical protein
MPGSLLCHRYVIALSLLSAANAEPCQQKGARHSKTYSTLQLRIQGQLFYILTGAIQHAPQPGHPQFLSPAISSQLQCISMHSCRPNIQRHLKQMLLIRHLRLTMTVLSDASEMAKNVSLVFLPCVQRCNSLNTSGINLELTGYPPVHLLMTTQLIHRLFTRTSTL